MSKEPPIDEKLSYRQLRLEDLELVLAWRSNPQVYEHFREQSDPLNWNDHLSWFSSRPNGRYDYIIEYNGRRVGSVNLTPDSFVGVYIGEVDLWGEGIGTSAIEWICQRHSREEFFAEIHEENTASQAIFEQCGFEKHDASDDWIIYRLQPES